MAADYGSRTVWRVAGTVDEVRAVLVDGPALPRWWPEVYLSVTTVHEGDENGWPVRSSCSPRAGCPTPCGTLLATEPITDTGYALTVPATWSAPAGGPASRTVPKS